MREMSVVEQRYKAVLAVIADGRTVTEVARDLGVSRQAVKLTEFVDTEVSTEMRGGDAGDRTRAH
jgi:FixJ family two-component response regulator